MAGAPADADPGIHPQGVPPGASEESIEAARRLQAVRTNLHFADLPKAISAAHYAGLRALGLLDFVRLDLSVSGAPRPDLAAELGASWKYHPRVTGGGGWSSVRGTRIKVSLDAFTEALRLPRRPTYRPPAGVDPSVVASAAKEFIKVYLPAHGWVEVRSMALRDGRAHDVDWTERLIWVERPELFWSPPEPAVADAAATLCIIKKQGSNPSAVKENDRPELFHPAAERSVEDAAAALCVPKKHGSILSAGKENRKRCSEPDMQNIEASSKKIEVASKKIDSASVIIDAAANNFNSASMMIDATSRKIDSASERFDEKFDVATNMMDAASKMIEATSRQLAARAKQLDEKDDDMQAIESLNKARVTKERKSNDELQAVRKMLIEVSEQLTPSL